ncbi:MAG: hypothetical protein RLZZ232_3912 [Planctomycetota bacterium]|jgi:hypothetical protein
MANDGEAVSTEFRLRNADTVEVTGERLDRRLPPALNAAIREKLRKALLVAKWWIFFA